MIDFKKYYFEFEHLKPAINELNYEMLKSKIKKKQFCFCLIDSTNVFGDPILTKICALINHTKDED